MLAADVNMTCRMRTTQDASTGLKAPRDMPQGNPGVERVFAHHTFAAWCHVMHVISRPASGLRVSVDFKQDAVW